MKKVAEQVVLSTQRRKNDYLLDKGIISGIEHELIPELVDELGLRDSFLYAGEKANLKQAFIGGRIYDLSMNPNNLLKFPLFTYKTKLRFFFEPFLPGHQEVKK